MAVIDIKDRESTSYMLVTLVNVSPDNGHKEENATGVDEKGHSEVPGMRE